MAHTNLRVIDSAGAVAEQPLQHGIEGNVQTLKIMAALVRRDHLSEPMRRLAAQLVRDVRGHDYAGEVAKLFAYAQRIRYVRDPLGLGEKIQAPAQTVMLQHGDCGDKSTLLATLLAALGHKARFVALSWQLPALQHVYVEVWDGQKWVALDPTPEAADVGWAAVNALKRYTFPIFDRGDKNDPANLGWLNFAIQGAQMAMPFVMGAVGGSSVRKQEESARDALKDQAFAALHQLRVEQAQGQRSPADALAQARSVVASYFGAVAQFRTESVRRSAENYRVPFANRLGDIEREGQELTAARGAASQAAAGGQPPAGGAGVLNSARAPVDLTFGGSGLDLGFAVVSPWLLAGGAAVVFVLARR